MGKGIFSLIVGVILLYTFLGWGLTEAGKYNQDTLTIESGIDPETELGAIEFMGNMVDVLTFKIDGVPTWVQFYIFGSLDLIILVAVAFYIRGVSD